VKTPRPIEEPGALTRRSKDPRSLRLGVAVKYSTDTEKYIGQVAYILAIGTFGRGLVYRNSWHRLPRKFQAA
jgi:hypothetical protein